MQIHSIVSGCSKWATCTVQYVHQVLRAYIQRGYSTHAYDKDTPQERVEVVWKEVQEKERLKHLEKENAELKRLNMQYKMVQNGC